MTATVGASLLAIPDGANARNRKQARAYEAPARSTSPEGTP